MSKIKLIASTTLVYPLLYLGVAYWYFLMGLFMVLTWPAVALASKFGSVPPQPPKFVPPNVPYYH